MYQSVKKYTIEGYDVEQREPLNVYDTTNHVNIIVYAKTRGVALRKAKIIEKRSNYYIVEIEEVLAND